jgi:hypothetical protein
VITLGIVTAPVPERRSPLRRGLTHSLPLVAFVASVPLFVECIPKPLAEADYVIVGCASTFMAMTVALFLITWRQMRNFTALTRGSDAGRAAAVPASARPTRGSTSNRAAASS